MSRVFVYLILSLPLVGAFAMLSLGIAVIYRSSRVLNLAHGAMAMVPAYIADQLARWGLPMPAWLALGVASGAVIGVVVQRAFVHTLRKQSATTQTVGTVAALGLLIALAVRIWGTTPRLAQGVFPKGSIPVGASHLRFGEIGLFGTAIVVAVVIFAMFRYTNAGRAMQATADNPRAASLVGIDPDASTRLAWAIAGALAGLAGILLAAVNALEPIQLAQLVLPAFVAALIGGLESIGGALAGAAVVGIVQGMVPAIALIPGVGGFATQVGAPQLVITIVAFVVMMLRGQRLSLAQSQGSTISSDAGVAARLLVGEGTDKRPRSAIVLAALGAALLIAWPFLHPPFSLLDDAAKACMLILIAASLVLLVGWVGQISLAQASFVGVGAFTTAVLVNRAGIQFPMNLPLAALGAAAVAALLGVVALRVRGLYLAVATLIFVWMSDEYLFRTSWFVGGGGGAEIHTNPIGHAGGFPYFEFTEARTFYFIAVAAAAAVLWGLANLRDSKTGRSFFAVRGSEVAAASLGINVMRTKLIAFSISGALAGIAGCLIAVGSGAASAEQFTFKVSLLYLAVTVVGGLQSLGGAVAASILFAALEEAFLRITALSGWLEVVSAGLLAIVLIAYPGGLGAALSRARIFLERFRPFAPRPHPVPHPRDVAEPPMAVTPDGPPPLDASGITVQFGGLTAVDGFSLRVGHGQIVGLIGPNGAGKTTLFNAISGLNRPTSGTVRIFGEDVSDKPVHTRARLGVGRTFQLIQLFGGLSVFDNLLVATNAGNPTGALAHVLATRPSLKAERQAIERVWEVVDLLDLHDVAARPVIGLPFGVLRMVELARALVSGARLVMLDEPASGLDNAETEGLARLLRMMRDRLGVSVLLIEHDVRLVTEVSDYVYVIEQGRPLADGTPGEISRNPAVVAAYLGDAPATAETARDPAGALAAAR